MSLHTRFNIARFSIQQPSLTLYFLLVLLLTGVASFFQLGQDEDPPFTFRAMVIQSYWPGATAMQMSHLVADPIERTLQEIPHVDTIRTYSKPAESTTFLILKDSTPPDQVRWLWYTARKKISDMHHELPQGVQGPFYNDEFGDVFGILYTLSGDGYSLAQLHDQADLVRQELLRVADVAKVEEYGVQDEVISVEVSQKRLASMGLDLNQVVTEIGQQNAISNAGVVRTTGDTVQVRISGQIKGVQALRDLSLRANGRNFRLGDIAQITRGYEDPPAPMVRSQGRPVIALGVSMIKGGDIIRLGQALNRARSHIQDNLPAGVELHQIEDQPKTVERSIQEFLGALSEALIIVLLVSFVSLGLQTHPLRIDIRPGLVVSLAIPLVLAVTFLIMDIHHIDLHKISLGALIIALGLLVDDAIIVVEMMVRKLDEGLDRLTASTAAYELTAMPMLTGTLITAAGFLPIGLARSAVGEYTYAIFAVTTAALLISWGVSVYFVPYLGYRLLKPSQDSSHDVFDTPFYRRFRSMVSWCLRYPWQTLGLTLGVVLLGLVGMTHVEQQFFPDSSRPEILVDLWLPEGSTIQASEQAAKRFERLLAHDPRVALYSEFIGSGAPRFFLTLDEQLVNGNLAEFIITPKNISERDSLRQHILELARTQLPMARVRARFLPNGPPISYPVAFRVSGNDPQFLHSVARIIEQRMRADTFLSGVNDNWNESVKSLHLIVDQDRARALGVSSASVAAAAQELLSGQNIGQYREGNKLIPIELKQPLDERSTLSALQDAYVPSASGQAIPIGQIVRLDFGWEPGIAWRENRQFTITIQADVQGDIQPATASAQVKQQIQDLYQLIRPGFSIKEAGTVAESAKGQDSIFANLPLMLFIMFSLLMLQLRSMGRALLVFFTGPLGVIGAAMALLISHQPFGFVAMLGVIALNGMIIRNSVILIDQIEQDRRLGIDPWTAVLEATVRRCRPILLTAAAAVLAMIPLSESIFWGPMAAGIMGGLIVATALTLLSLPAAYAVCFGVPRSAPAAIHQGSEQ